MTSRRSGPGAPVLLLPLVFLAAAVAGQDFGEQCLDQFKQGRVDFTLDTDDSVKDGATFLSAPKARQYKDCVRSCCADPRCNVAFVEAGAEEGLVKSCFLFDCLYKKKYVCRFVKKTGYMSYFLHSVYESDLAMETHVGTEDSPPVANGGQDRVIQPQDSVTLNGIESKDDNAIESYQWVLVSGDPGAVIEKTNFDDQVIVSNLMSGVYKFQLTVTDNIGQTGSTLVTVLVLTPEQSEDHCMAPPKVGPCRGSFPRWHYNGASQKCEQFMFGGCRENLNNYLSFDECTNACYGSETNDKSGRGLPVAAPKVEKCGAACTGGQFTCANGCCLDPGLDCDKLKQCSDGSDEKDCRTLDNDFQILLQIPVDEQKARCTEAPVTGDCRDSFTKWYYNPVAKTCFRFNYGGCHGNDNRFDTMEACTKMCRGVTGDDVFAGKGEFGHMVSDNETVTIVIAALLGVCILVLVGILAYCFLKGKKRQRQPQHQRGAVSGTQVLTTEDTERLVYNTTTKPI